jgi:hypothetical protein
MVVPRQILCYIATEMGYTELEISKSIYRDRTTVNCAKKTVLDALTYNNVEYRKVFLKFIKHLKDEPGGDALRDLD